MEKILNHKGIRTLLKTTPTVFLVLLYLVIPTEFVHAGLPERIAAAFTSAMATAADFILGNIFEGIAWVLEIVASMFASLGSQFLDAMIRYGINGNNFQITGIISGWTIFRDLVNMIFIFILLYVAIMTILQASSFNTKKILANLIIIALLVNFSFFLTGFVIDIGNALAVTIYDAVTPGGSSLGGILVDRMDLAQLKDAAENTSNFMMGAMHLMNALFFMIAAFVFFAGGFLFLARHVTLLFVLMLSPVAFAACILDKTRPQFNKWLSHLLNSTFVAPIYLLLMAVTVTISSAGGLLQGADADNVQTGLSGQIASPFLDKPGLLINYLVIIALMISSLVIAKNIAGGATNFALKMAGGVTGYGLGKIAGGTNRLVGGAFARNRNRTVLQDMATNPIDETTGKRKYSALRSFGARQEMKLMDKGAKMNLNAAKPLASTLGAFGLQHGIDTKAGKGGYDQWKKDDIAKEQARSKMYDNTTAIRERKEEVDKKTSEFSEAERQLNEQNTTYKTIEDEQTTKDVRAAEEGLKSIQIAEEKVATLNKESAQNEKDIEALTRDKENAQYDGRNEDENEIDKKIKKLSDEETTRQDKLAKAEQDLNDRNANKAEYENLVNSNQDLINSQKALQSSISKLHTKTYGAEEKRDKDGHITQAKVVGLAKEKKDSVAQMMAGTRRSREDYADTIHRQGFFTSLGRTKKERRDTWSEIRVDAGKSREQRVSEDIRKWMDKNESGDFDSGPTPPPPSPTSPTGGPTT